MRVRRTIIAVAAVSTALLLGACAPMQFPEAQTTTCSPVGADGSAGMGIALPAFDVDIEITDVRPSDTDAIEVTGWHRAAPGDEIGGAHPYAVPADAEHMVPAGEHRFVNVGLRLVDPSAKAETDAIDIDYVASGTTWTTTRHDRIILLPAGEACS